jgi:hypothetical protein
LCNLMNHVTKLFVVWQDALSRRFFPVGQLTRTQHGARTVYEFRYTKGAHEAIGAGFQPFLAFPRIDEVYEDEELFPFFGNRLIPQMRDDYVDFVRSLGLDPTTATDMDILARSGGRRVTDCVELFATPQTTVADGCLAYFFLSHGLSHMLSCAQEKVLSLAQGNRLFVVHDLQNPVDEDALLLRTEDYCCVGFLPRYLCSDTWRLLHKNADIQIFVEQVNPPPAPIQQRILCRMIAKPVPGFAPCSDEVYQPLG